MTREEIVAMLVANEQMRAQCADLASANTELERRVAWFTQQMFGQKSERRALAHDPRQLTLGEWLMAGEPIAAEVTVAEHLRRKRTPEPEEVEDQADLRFDPSVPVEEIRVAPPTVDDQHEIVGEKVTYRLAQRPSSYVVLRYIRPVVKRKSDAVLSCAPAPTAVLGKSVADVSTLACLLMDKFLYHLPLYRQHQRMEAAGIHLARSTLTGWAHRIGDLLQPVYGAQFASVLQSGTLTMDETPIKAGPTGSGKMKTGYFWPIYGDRGEVVFPFSETRSAKFVADTLRSFGGVLLTDGYAAYESYAAKVNGVVHAQCWSHTRRQFVAAEKVEPQLTTTALDFIRRLYEVEKLLSTKAVDDTRRIELRTERSKPIVDAFFDWLKQVLVERVLLPRNPFTEAAEYALDRESALRVFLEYPAVPIDTNHLEREIRPIALGRKNWLFCWTEIGAHYVGIFQSLLATCRLQGIDPYVYLVDVLQRVDRHPARNVELLTPRLWKEHFAAEPLRSAVDRVVKNADS